jgi:hypothetical protein
MIVTQGLNGQDLAQGSGFFIAGDVIATNLHVFKNADQAYVKTVIDGVNYQIENIIGFDRINDLCVFRLKRASGQPLSLASNDEVKVGNDVYVAGNPRGLEGSISKGIVSAIREMPKLIQIDAAISPGSSGGPAVNDHGKVIGIASAGYQGGQNLNFAEPIQKLKELTLDWKLSVRQTGLLALTDCDLNNLRGPVQNVVETNCPMYPDSVRQELVRNTGRLVRDSLPGPVSRYNEIGDLVERKEELVDGSLVRHVHCEYTSSGILTHRMEIDNVTNKRSDDSFSEGDGVKQMYVERGRMDLIIKRGYVLGKNGQVVGRFDGNGHETEAHIAMMSWIRTFGPDGLETETRNYSNGQLDDIERFTYETDDFGNWIKKVTMSRSSDDPENRWEPLLIVLREITYFKR